MEFIIKLKVQVYFRIYLVIFLRYVRIYNLVMSQIYGIIYYLVMFQIYNRIYNLVKSTSGC